MVHHTNLRKPLEFIQILWKIQTFWFDTNVAAKIKNIKYYGKETMRLLVYSMH